MPAPFVHLHLHTQYSLLDGAIKHNPLFERAKAANMPAVAQTDHGNLFGTVEFYEKARANGVKPIIGCEVYFAGGSRFDRKKAARRDRASTRSTTCCCLAMDERGYREPDDAGLEGLSRGFYYKPRIDLGRCSSEYAPGADLHLRVPLGDRCPRAIIANEPDTGLDDCRGLLAALRRSLLSRDPAARHRSAQEVR